MTDAPTILRTNIDKQRLKVEKLRTALAAAELELNENETALRVLVKLGLAPEVECADDDLSESMTDTQSLLLGAIPYGIANAAAPKDVYATLRAKGNHGVTADYVRTALWRLKKRGIIDGDSRHYWRTDASPATKQPENEAAPNAEALEADKEFGRVAELEEPASSEQHPFRKGENVGSSPTPPSHGHFGAFDSDLDDDDPF
jgi:hypothetical protein